MTAKTTLHDTDLVPIVDVEATPDETKYMTGANLKSQITNATSVNAAGAVMESDFNATTFLYATADNTPQPKNVAETKTILSLNNVENTAHSTDAHTMAIDGRDVSVDGTKLDGIAAGANAYVHPNHSGDVTSVADGAQTIANKVTMTATSPVTVSGTPTVIAGGAVAIAIPAATNAAAGHATAAHITAVEANTAKVTNATHTGEVTGSGALTITADAVTYAKMQNVSATDKVLGRATAGAGDVEEIACTSAGRALLDDADAAAQKTTLSLNLVENTAHSSDAHTMTIDGVDVSAHAALSLGAHGIPADPGEDKYLMWDDDPGALVWSSPAGAGDVTGPAASTDNMIARHDGAAGKTLQDYTSNPPTVSDTGDMNIDGDLDVENIVVSGTVDGVDVSAHASRHDSGGADQIHSIADDDDDTKIQVEESADEDIIRMDVAGVEAFKLSAVGIVTFPKQSSIRVNQNTLTAQKFASVTMTRIILEDESWDLQNEWNNRKVTGTADATEASKLHDADGGFEAADVGAWLWNTTDNTYTTVSAFVDSGELTLTDDIMVSGEGYVLYHSYFTATEAGYYQVSCNWGIISPVADKRGILNIYKNGARTTGVAYHSSHTSNYFLNAGDLLELAANDIVDFRGYHDMGAVKTGDDGADITFLAITKVA